MKKLFPFSLMALLILAVTLSSICYGGNSRGITYSPGQQSSPYTVGGVTFYMRYAPTGSFTSDDDTISGNPNLPGPINVANAYCALKNR